MKLFKKKDRVAPRATADEGFVEATGPHYLRLLELMHHDLTPDCYLEIGTRKGDSLKFASCTSIAIDPEFLLEHEVLGAKPRLHLLQETSDDAFASPFFSETGLRPDFAFLDGMHLFEYVLRDFMNVEKLARPGATIAVHDCIPFTHVMAERDWDKSISKEWTGDVWKLIPALKKYRPDLDLRVMDAEPTGLLVIANLDPGNATLFDQYDTILGEFLGINIADYGVARFFSDFEFSDTAAEIARIEALAGSDR